MMRQALIVAAVAMLAAPANAQPTRQSTNEALLAALQQVHGLTTAQTESLRVIFRRSGYVSQGNPAITVHPVTSDDCADKLASENIVYGTPAFETICGARYMAPLYDPASQRPEDATACIDQFEFPNIPCAYPLVWVRAREAAMICWVLGKRLCDAHEWEGACAGKLEEPDYRFDLAGKPPEAMIRLMREAHNRARGVTKLWSYGPEYRSGVCGTSGRKTAGCDGGSWSLCGSNTFPSGYFPDCTSPLAVYDLHGNAAEHMNLPLDPSQMASRGSKTLGHTEMKGSWFVFDTYRAHDDWCRWRAPYWHGSRVMDPDSHRNYHLSFRCCKTVNETAP